MIFKNDIKYEVDISNIFHNTPWSVSVNVSFMSWRSINWDTTRNLSYHNAELVNTMRKLMIVMNVIEFESRRMRIVYFRPCLLSCFFACHTSNANHDWKSDAKWYLHAWTNLPRYSITPSSSCDLCVFVCLIFQTYQNPYAESDVLRSSLSVVFSYTRNVASSLLQMSLNTSLRRFSFVKKNIYKLRTKLRSKFVLRSCSAIRSSK